MEEQHPMTTDPYADAPDLGHETAALHDLRQLLNGKRIDTGLIYREYLLRHAAHLDRIHADPTWDAGEDQALDTAWELIQYDRTHATWLGGIGPDSATWTTEDGALQYVRREWRTWWAQQNLNTAGGIQA